MDFRDIREFFNDTFKYIIVVIIVLLLFIFVVGLQGVVGPSMSPKLKEGNIILVNKFKYRFKDVKRYDVIVLSQDDKYMIKRVIGIPGDYIEYKNNNLYINGKLTNEDFIDKTQVKTNDFSLKNLGYTQIPEGKYLVLGDNREDSMDSRDYGLVDKKNIIGKASLRIWPLNKIGKI